MVIGTPPYMSPEQAQGLNDELTGASDQYSLGLILFELVALKPAVTGKSPIKIVQRAQEAKKDPFVHAFGEAIPRELTAIVEKATQLRPEDRYADVAELVADVQRYLRDEAVKARRDTLFQGIQRWISHHRQLTLMVMFALLTSLFAVGFGSVVVLGVALGVDNYLADLRQARLSEVVASVAQQGHRIDAEFQHYAGELASLSSTAEYALADPNPPGAQVYFAEAFAARATAPPDFQASKIYDESASLDFPDHVTAPGSDRDALRTQFLQLQSLQPHMLRMILRSDSAEAALALAPEKQRRLVLDEGVPMIWAYVATSEGVLTGMPGTGDYPAAYDPRVQTWYKRAQKRPGVQWGVEDDESGQGLLVSASSGLYDPTGRPVGVAGLDISLAHVTGKMLVPPAAHYAMEAFLVDDTGFVNASTRTTKDAKERPKFHYPQIVERVTQGETTGVTEIDGNLVVWCRLDVVEWTYVVVANQREALGTWF
jgi:serine/threonine-protein kinase